MGEVFPLIDEPDEDRRLDRTALCARRPIRRRSSRRRAARPGRRRRSASAATSGPSAWSTRLVNDERFGIWGGLSERERRRLKKSAV